MTLDRYLAITRPLQYTRKISHRKVKWCIALIWFGSILTTFLSSILMWILNFIIEDDNQRAISRRQIEQNVYFHIVLSILTFYIPFVLILYFNIATYVTIKRRLLDKKLKFKKIDINRSSQHILMNDAKQSDQLETNHSNNSTITSQHLLNSSSTNNLSSSSSTNDHKLCLNCFQNQNYISVISGDQIDLNNNTNDQSINSLRNSFKKKINNRRCSLCSCHLNRFKKESINSQFNASYHFSLANTYSFTIHAFQRTLEKLQQKHKDGLKKNYNFVFKEYKLIKLLLTINLCFAACWAPIYIYQELVRFNFVLVDNHLLNYLLFLGWLNSGIDPIIYLYLSKKMRKEIREKFFCLKS